MPIYEYVCADCDTKFEQMRPMRSMDESVECPSGHTQAQRVLSTFAALTKDPLGEASSIGGGGCGGCGGSCTNCACSVN